MELKKMKEEEINPTTYSLLWIYLIWTIIYFVYLFIKNL
jgi:hypothetical protein